MSNNTAGRSRLDADARRQQILRVASEMFGTLDYDQVSLDDVARAAGISRGLVYHYFPGKRALLSAVVRAEAEQLLRLTEPDPALPPADRLRAGLDAYLDYVENHAHSYRALYLRGLHADGEIRGIVERNLRRQAQRILHSITDRATAPPALRLAVEGWLAFLITTCLKWLDERPIPRDQLRELCVRTLTAAIAASGFPHAT